MRVVGAVMIVAVASSILGFAACSSYGGVDPPGQEAGPTGDVANVVDGGEGGRDADALKLVHAKTLGAPDAGMFLTHVAVTGRDAYVTGNFGGSIEMGGVVRTPTGSMNNDGILLRANRDGEIVWVRQEADAICLAVAAELSRLYHACARDTGLLQNDEYDAVFHLLDNDGVSRNSATASGPGKQIPWAAAVAPVGVWFTVTSTGQLALNDAGAYGPSGSARDVVLVYLFGGTSIAERLGGEEANATGLAYDPSGGLVVAGEFRGILDLSARDGGTLATASIDDVDAFVVKLSDTRAVRYATRIGGGGAQVSSSLLTTGADAFVAGSSDGELRVGSWTIASDKKLGFVVRLGPDGAPKWVTPLSGTGETTVAAMALTASGNVVAFGTSTGTVDLGGGRILSNAGARDIFLVVLSGADGAVLDGWHAPGTGDDIAGGVGVDVDGAIILAGTFKETIDFGAGPVTAKGIRDGYLLKLTPPAR